MRKHRLELVWNQFGDNCIHDKVAKTTTVLPFKPLSIEKSLQHKSLCLVDVKSPENSKARLGQANLVLLDQIASVEAFGGDIIENKI